jgi:hypothetical protein
MQPRTQKAANIAAKLPESLAAERVLDFHYLDKENGYAAI